MVTLLKCRPVAARFWIALVAVVAGSVLVSPSSAASKLTHEVVGAVYTETNDTSRNQVIVFNRYADGHLKRVQSVGTGGKGGAKPQPGCSASCPILDAQGELALTPSGHLLFAVNAGSNTVSAFRTTSRGLKLVDQRSSGGVFPDSLTVHGNLLYVVNNNSANIAGFRFSSSGKLRPIPGSSRPLSAAASTAVPRQIGFDNTGKLLVVTLLAASEIDTFVMKANGKPGLAVAYKSTPSLPFGFAFDPRDRLVVSRVTGPNVPGDTATYKVTGSGRITPIDTKGSNGPAPCWVAITGNGRHVFVVDNGPVAAPDVTRYALGRDGELTFQGKTATPGPLQRTDEVLSRNNRYLYVLAPTATADASSHIDEYKVGTGGSLKLIGTTPSKLPAGISGLVGG